MPGLLSGYVAIVYLIDHCRQHGTLQTEAMDRISSFSVSHSANVVQPASKGLEN